MKKKLGILLLILFLALLPLFTGKYLLYVTIHILLLSIFSLGFNLLFGYTGLLSFGQAGFYAAGAYGCAKILLAYPSLLCGIVGGVAVGTDGGLSIVSVKKPLSDAAAAVPFGVGREPGRLGWAPAGGTHQGRWCRCAARAPAARGGGDVVMLPLAGVVVVVTRPAAQAARFAELVAAAGATPLLLPAIEIEPVELDAASRARLTPDDFDWTIYTSANAVECSLRQLPRPQRTRIAAVGRATARALQEHGITVSALPRTTADSEGLLALECFADLRGHRVLILKGRGGRTLLRDELARRGAENFHHRSDPLRSVEADYHHPHPREAEAVVEAEAPASTQPAA